jgi:Flp pilus assembly protein TadG
MIGRPRKRSGAKAQRGSVLFEQALTLVFLLTVMFGIIDCARMLYAYHYVSHAAREATRWASVRSSTSRTLPHSSQGAIQGMVSHVPGMGLDSSKITATVNYLSPPNGSPSCPANQPGCVVQVQVKYDYKFFFPFLPSDAVTMQSTSEMVISQ